MQVRARSCVQQTRKSNEWLFCAQLCTGAECTGMVTHNFSPLCIFKPGFCASRTTSVVQVLCKGTWVLYKLHDKCCATTALAPHPPSCSHATLFSGKFLTKN